MNIVTELFIDLVVITYVTVFQILIDIYLCKIFSYRSQEVLQLSS